MRHAKSATVAATLALAAGAAVAQEVQIPLNYNFNGMVHFGEGFADDPSGFRSISDRALLIDGQVGSFATNPVVGATGLNYGVNTTAFALDIVHLGNRAVFFPYDAVEDFDNIGIAPTWDTSPNHTGPQVTDVSGLNIEMFGNTEIGVLYQISNGGGAFDVVLTFTDASSVTVRLAGPDWFGAQNPAAPGLGVASQTRLGATTWPGTNNNDQGTPAPVPGQNLNVIEGVITAAELINDGLGSIIGKTLSSISFQNAAYPAGTGRGYAIIAATVDGSATFNPSGIGSVVPNPAVFGQPATFRVAVSPGSGTPNTITSVSVDASSIDGGTLNLNDSGVNGDETAGDGLWSVSTTISLNAPAGPASLPFTITDAQTRQGTGNIDVTIAAPPIADDLGTLTAGLNTFSGAVNAGEVRWVRFNLATPIDRDAMTFLDIDTEGSALSNNDSELGLYSANGNLIATDDDDGSGLLTQLSFGLAVPPRPAVNGSVAYNGRDGATLAAGTYYLAYGSFNMTFGATLWNVTSTSTATGTVNINLFNGDEPPSPVVAGPINNPANGSDYYLLVQGYNFTQAEAAAQSLGGHLASIADAEENEFVRANVLRFDGADRRGWIGFTDEAVEGTFVWTDGTPNTYTNWNAGEPNNASGLEHYTEMLGNGLWNDLPLAGAAGGSDFAIVEVPGTGGCPACAADFDQSGGVDGDDIGAFFAAWQTGDTCGDVDRSGGVDGDDIGAFFVVWQAGGC